MRKTRPTGARHAGAVPRGRTGHRGRWVVIALAVGVPALVVPSLVLTPDESEPVRVDSAAYYQFVSVRDGTALDVAGAGAASRQWQLKGLAGGYCQLVNHDSGKVLGRSATSAADVEQQPDTGATAQQWRLTDVGGGAVKIVSRDGGMVLSVTGGTDRHVVVQSTDRGTADQRWNLAKAETAATPAAPAWPPTPAPGSGSTTTGTSTAGAPVSSPATPTCSAGSVRAPPRPVVCCTATRPEHRPHRPGRASAGPAGGHRYVAAPERRMGRKRAAETHAPR